MDSPAAYTGPARDWSRVLELTLENTLADRIASVGLFEGLDDATRRALAEQISLVELPPGQTLFRQGDDANSVFLVLEGRLSVLLDGDGEDEQLLTALFKGDIVGEVALVAGGKRSATVRVDEPATLAELPVAALNRLLADSPEISSRMVELVSRRLRRSQFASQLSNLFEGLDDDTLAEIEQAIEWVSLTAGETLYHEGDTSDAAYLVVSGRVRVQASHPDTRIIEEVGRGDMVGQLALMDDEPRTATVFAARDTELARLRRSAFEKLLRHHPTAMLAAARAVFRRTRAPSPELRRSLGAELSITIIPAEPGLDLAPFVAQLATALREHGKTACLDPEHVDAMLYKPGIANSVSTEPANIRLVQSLNEIEAENRFVIYQADATLTPWTRRAIRQADHLLTVGDARRAVSAGDIELMVERARPRHHPRWDLVLLHQPDVARPSGTSRWFDTRDVGSVYHVRQDNRGDIERLGRILAGRAVSVVFGGGGARGFAHLGVLRALEELGVPIDLVGGTSMGAPMATAPARGITPEEALAEAIAGFDSILDYTLPVVSLLSGRRITDSITNWLGGWDIEDLWLPYFCISTNITRAGQVIHSRGSLSRAVRASVAIPGVLPPVPEGEDLLVDGGVINNLPMDVMRELNPTGPMIVIDVVPPQGPSAKSDYGLSLSGWKLAAQSLIPGRKPYRPPGIGGAILRSMLVGADSARQRMLQEGLPDFYLNVRMRKVGMLEFDAVERIEQLGYDQGLDRLRKWIDDGGLKT